MSYNDIHKSASGLVEDSFKRTIDAALMSRKPTEKVQLNYIYDNIEFLLHVEQQIITDFSQNGIVELN